MPLADDGKKSIIVLTVLTPIVTIFVALRLFVRKKRKVLGADDALLSFALFMVYLQYTGSILRTSTLSASVLTWVHELTSSSGS